MNITEQVNSQREAQYRSLKPPGHHHLAPIRGEYQIIDVEIKEQGSRSTHLATATWRISQHEPIVATTSFRFYLECLFNENATFPADANIGEMNGKTITILNVYRCRQTKGVVFAAAWIFSKNDKSSSIANYDLGQSLSGDDLIDIISSGLHLNETGIEWENETEYEDLDTNEEQY